jgi:hypothetical protein
MRIVRLTTTDPEGIFDNNFDSELLIKPQSQLALKSCVFETQNKVIEIDSSNNEITFQVQTGNPQTYAIPNGEFNATNYGTLFTNMMKEANKKLVKTAPQNIGMEVFYGVEKNDEHSGRFTQQYFQGEYFTGKANNIDPNKVYPNGQLALQLQKGSVNYTRTGGTTQSAEGRFQSAFSGSGGQSFGDSFMYADKYISRGAGQVSFQVRNVDMTIGNEQGIFGFTTTNPNTFTSANPPSLSDIAYGVKITNTTATDGTGGSAYEYIVAGISTPSPVNLQFFGVPASVSSNNDYIRAGVSGGQVYIDIHQIDLVSGNPISTSILNEDYTFPDKLFPIWISLTSGARAGPGNINFVFTKLRWTASPREERIVPEPQPQQDLLTDTQAPLQPNTQQQECFMSFEGDSLASFLGYRFTRSPSVPGSFTIVPVSNRPGNLQIRYEVLGDDLFRPTALSDAFIVELLNLQVNSYDGLKESRKPYLAVVPRSDADGSVIYDTTFPVFVDLDNADALNLRNIKARLLNSDGSEVLIEGLASLVILIKARGE